MDTKTCTKCNRTLSLDKFHKKGKRLNARCGECINAYFREHYHSDPDRKKKHLDRVRKWNDKRIEENRLILLNHLQNNPCSCGESDIMVLQFDHDDPSKKSYDVTSMMTFSSKRLLEEIAKCTVRCGNCHIRRTNEQFGWWKTKLPDVYPLADNESKG